MTLELKLHCLSSNTTKTYIWNDTHWGEQRTIKFRFTSSLI